MTTVVVRLRSRLEANIGQIKVATVIRSRSRSRSDRGRDSTAAVNRLRTIWSRPQHVATAVCHGPRRRGTRPAPPWSALLHHHLGRHQRRRVRFRATSRPRARHRTRQRSRRRRRGRGGGAARRGRRRGGAERGRRRRGQVAQQCQCRTCVLKSEDPRQDLRIPINRRPSAQRFRSPVYLGTRRTYHPCFRGGQKGSSSLGPIVPRYTELRCAASPLPPPPTLTTTQNYVPTRQLWAWDPNPTPNHKKTRANQPFALALQP